MTQHDLYPNIALDIQFRHMPKYDELRRIATQQLDTFYPFALNGSRCVVVCGQSHSSQHGTVCDVTIRFHIPGRRLYVAHNTGSGGSKELLFATLNDAFGDLRRQMIKTRTKRHHQRRIAA